MAGIVLQNVGKTYPDGTTAVSNFTLEVGDGEFMVLVGPSGCGKTTVLRMVAGLEEITDGDVRIGGRVVNDVRARDRDVAMVFQNYALYPHMSVHDNMAFGLKLRNVPKQEIARRVGIAANILGLEDLLERRPRALSGGQRQRVAMGRAIVREPQAFLMDEPLSNLDAKLRVQMRSEIARIQRRLHTTTIYVTHDQVEAMTMGDRVAVMRRGVLQQAGPPMVLYDRPHNLFVGGFIGSPAMNMVEASLDRSEAGTFVEFGGYRLRVDDEALRLRPGLAEHAGRKVIVGVRPEDFRDADLAGEVPSDRRIEAVVDLREALGSRVTIHFAVNAPAVLTEDTRELARDLGADVQRLEQQTTSNFVAQLEPGSRAREGERIALVVDTARLHFFDPATSLAIYGV